MAGIIIVRLSWDFMDQYHNTARRNPPKYGLKSNYVAHALYVHAFCRRTYYNIVHRGIGTTTAMVVPLFQLYICILAR